MNQNGKGQGPRKGYNHKAFSDNYDAIFRKPKKVNKDPFPHITSLIEKSSELPAHQPCGHRGCLSHVTHPCEKCGRIAGEYPIKLDVEDEMVFLQRNGKWLDTLYSRCPEQGRDFVKRFKNHVFLTEDAVLKKWDEFMKTW